MQDRLIAQKEGPEKVKAFENMRVGECKQMLFDVDECRVVLTLIAVREK